MSLAQAGQVGAMVEESMQQAGQRAMDALQGLVLVSGATEGPNGASSGVSSTAVSFRASLCIFIKPQWDSSTHTIYFKPVAGGFHACLWRIIASLVTVLLFCLK